MSLQKLKICFTIPNKIPNKICLFLDLNNTRKTETVINNKK